MGRSLDKRVARTRRQMRHHLAAIAGLPAPIRLRLARRPREAMRTDPFCRLALAASGRTLPPRTRRPRTPGRARPRRRSYARVTRAGPDADDDPPEPAARRGRSA